MKTSDKAKLQELVFMSLGAASMCWTETPAGIFKSTEAKMIGEQLIKDIEKLFSVGDIG